MAMFNGKEKGEKQKGFEMKEGEIETIIGASVKVEGDFKSDGDVLVQGIVNGSLKTKGNLKVEEGAKIKANVEAANASVWGEIAGNVTVKDSLQLGESAKIAGDIITKILSIMYRPKHENIQAFKQIKCPKCHNLVTIIFETLDGSVAK